MLKTVLIINTVAHNPNTNTMPVETSSPPTPYLREPNLSGALHGKLPLAVP